jgi:hypothetical protein
MAIHEWINTQNITETQFKCGYCGSVTAPNVGYLDKYGNGAIFICPNCTKPTYLEDEGIQIPNIRLGNDVSGITDQGVQSLYNEARDCTSTGAYTAAVMVCRKILMNFAVAQKANPGDTFVNYVTYLSDNGFIPPLGKPWVDQIRKKGNEANHEILLMGPDDANLILHFTEALLRFNYEFPAVLAADAAKKTKQTP